MLQAKMGDAIRSRTDTAMTNEVLCKLVAHNLCCLIMSQIELGIDPLFKPTKSVIDLKPPQNCVAVVQDRRDDYEEFRFSD